VNKEMLQTHLDVLAKQLGCELHQYNPSTPGMMYVEFGYVEGPTLDDIYGGGYRNIESRYMVNMHELGHFAHGHTQGRPPKQNETWYFDNGVLNSEAEAWEWALDNSILESYDKATRDYMWNTCLNSYYSHAQMVGFDTPGQTLGNGDRHYVKFAFGKPRPLFHTVKRRLIGTANA